MLALGLMSGTSMDGIDAALLETDGERVGAFGAALTLPYPDGFRAALRGVLGGVGDVAGVEAELTRLHAEAVRHLLRQANHPKVDVIGFHGHTILHRPDQRRTWQIGDGAALARALGIPVVNDFRSMDVAGGGQGAPLVPVFHRALAEALPRPLAVLNLGGVGNVTWIGEGGHLVAFDTGPANAPIDDWLARHTGQAADFDGRLARGGTADTQAVNRFAEHPYFKITPPKSLDRDDFAALLADLTAAMSPTDGAATLTACAARAVSLAARHFPAPAGRWLVCGGGRHNPALMAALSMELTVPVEPVEGVGWNGDALEAQAFAFLAVRSLRGLELTYRETTGGPAPSRGGRFHAGVLANHRTGG